ncbi:MAG: class I SAM-dependent methyltransferase [Chloroflexota bacterium]
MNWRRKAQIQNVVAALPLSNAIYFALQRTCGSLRRGRTSPREWLQAAAQLVAWAEGAGRSVVGARFLEVGTGRNVNIPLALWLWGARAVTTVDLNPYLSRTLVFESLAYLRTHEAEVAQLFGARAAPEEFRARFAQLRSFSGDLKSLLRLTNIEYLAAADAGALPLPDHSFDFHISHAVFEHIPAASITRILNEARRLLAPGGLLLHVIDPSDHFAHDDPTITAVNFLQFDERAWQRLAGNQFMYHNRLRSFEYLDLFAGAGVRVLRKAETLDEPSLRALRDGFPLQQQFRHIAPEALAVRSLNVLGTFREGS